MSKTTDATDRFARAILTDRHFDAAATSYLEAFVSWRRGLGNFNKVVSSGARQRIMKNILCLHFGNATDNPDDGATFERLLNQSNRDENCVACGPRVLRTVITLAQRTGHITVSQGWYDRRLKILRPTDKWIAQEADRHEVALASLSLLSQDRSSFAVRPRGAALVARLAIGASRSESPVGVTLGEPDAAMRSVAALDGGLATAFAVTDAWMRGRRTPSHKEIGASFRLSASQARKILRLAADNGLVGFDREGKINDANGLVQASRRLVAHEFALYARCVAPFETTTSEPIVAPALLVERRPEHAH
jgi:hypothetical protein